MGEPSLAYTAVTKANQRVFMTDKIWYKFSDQTTKFDAWKTWANTSGSTAQKAAAANGTDGFVDASRARSPSWLQPKRSRSAKRPSKNLCSSRPTAWMVLHLVSSIRRCWLGAICAVYRRVDGHQHCQ